MLATRCAIIASCLAACMPAQTPISQPPAPFALSAHDANLEASVYVEVVGHEAGSGVVISKDGLILTSEHVVREADRTILVALPDGRKTVAVIVAKSPASDLALLRAAWLEPRSVVSLTEEDVRADDPIYSIGYPGGHGPVTLWGTVKTFPFSVDMRPAEPADFKDGILASIPSDDGASGQPDFSAATGKLIGIQKLSLTFFDGKKSVLVSTTEIRRFLEANGVTLP